MEIMNWTDISTEVKRVYRFKDGYVRIDNPVRINISSSGGHRIVDEEGNGHYVPSGWIHLKWYNKDGVQPVVM